MKAFVVGSVPVAANGRRGELVVSVEGGLVVLEGMGARLVLSGADAAQMLADALGRAARAGRK